MIEGHEKGVHVEADPVVDGGVGAFVGCAPDDGGGPDEGGGPEEGEPPDEGGGPPCCRVRVICIIIKTTTRNFGDIVRAQTWCMLYTWNK